MPMRLHHHLLAFLALLVAGSAALQALSIDEIRRSGLYYWGMGQSTELSMAEKEALAALVNQISVNVQERTSIVNRSSTVRAEGKPVTDERSSYASMVSTYSQATLDNSETLQWKDGDMNYVVRYIPKANVYRVFEDRRKRIDAHLTNAARQLSLDKVDVALKDYYRAYALLLSMPSTSTEEWHGKVLYQYIPAKIDEVLADINVTVDSRDGNDYRLLFTYQGRPVHSLDYFYYENGVPGPMAGAGEGYGEITLLSPEPPRSIEVEIEYMYLDQASDPQMLMILGNPFRYESKYRIKTIPLGSVASRDSRPAPVTSPASDMKPAPAPVPAPEPVVAPVPDRYVAYAATARRLLEAIEAKTPPSKMRDILVDSIMLKYKSIISAGNVKVIDADSLEFSMAARGDVLCRGAVLLFKYRSGKYRNFSRDIAITFNHQGKVSNINMGLGKTPRRNIEETTGIPLYVRQAIMEFIENYQTAFALRDLDYISRIFDDNAIIFTFTQLPRAAGRLEDYGYRNDSRLICNRYTKDTYLQKMDAAFKSREYINLRFNKIDIDIVDEDRQIYAISLEQDYFSPSYSDSGHLFLLARFEDPLNPVIHVRTWQPEFVRPRELFNKFDFPITF